MRLSSSFELQLYVFKFNQVVDSTSYTDRDMVAFSFHGPIIIICVFFVLVSSCSCQHHYIVHSTKHLKGFTGISDFKILNRRVLLNCPDPNPYLQINISSNSGTLSDEEYVTVNVTGVLAPDDSDWVAMVSPSVSDISDCPENTVLYKETGDLSDLPLLCHYPVKAQYLNNDPGYINCKHQQCQKYVAGDCVLTTCGGSVIFHVINIRTDVEFVFFTGGFKTPCILKRSDPISFNNPQMPLYGHISSVDSTGASIKLTWVSGDNAHQQVQYGGGKSESSQVSTFTKDDMCSGTLPSPAKDFGWHDPGYIHSAVMTGLQPSSTYSYKYGSDSVGWSNEIQFRTPPAAGSDELHFLVYGDMGKAPRDPSAEHYIQPGSISVTDAMADEIEAGNVDSIFHIGDISYATGFLVEWDYFLQLITPIASRVSYMTAIGNHERDYEGSGSVYITPDSGGECGVAYEAYFPMPTPDKDKPWYSVEQASVHFTVISTEHDWSEGSEQYQWMQSDLQSVDRERTQWLIFTGHRPMYSSVDQSFLPSVDKDFVTAVEPLLLGNKVDLALFGHVHNYERTCAVFQNECKSMPVKDQDGIDTYSQSNYSAPIHVIVGMAGFKLDGFSDTPASWSLSRVSQYGYTRVHATNDQIELQFISSTTKSVQDQFRINK